MGEILNIHKIGFRLLKMIHGVDSAILPLHLLEVCLSVIQVYAGLLLTAGLNPRPLAGSFRPAAEWAPYLLLLPLLLVYTSLFSLGIGLALAALAVFFRDVLHIWSIVRMAWMYATPLFYPVEILPEWMLQIEAFNPMYHFVTYFREIALWGITPGLAENGVCALMAVVAFLIGLFIFRRAQKKFILYV